MLVAVVVRLIPVQVDRGLMAVAQDRQAVQVPTALTVLAAVVVAELIVILAVMVAKE
jgi:hypothetical protein